MLGKTMFSSNNSNKISKNSFNEVYPEESVISCFLETVIFSV